MDTVSDFFKYLEDIGVHIALVLAGSVGAFVKMGKRDELNLIQKMVVVLSGGAIANYATPIVFNFINVSENLKFGMAFFLGFWGLNGVKWIIFKFKEKYGDNDFKIK